MKLNGKKQMYKEFFSHCKQISILFFISTLSLPSTLYASFIESTIGTAVVNDATATLYNPAALTLLKSPQLVGLGSFAYFRTEFTGQATIPRIGFTQSGSTRSHTYYYLPSAYFALPAGKIFTFGAAIISNYFNKDFENDSLLRYAQSHNRLDDIDFVAALGVKLNEYFSVGAGLNYSRVSILMEPITGIPRLNIPDSLSRNQGSGESWGWDVGVLFKPAKSTLMGFNYRSALTYDLSGSSTFESHPPLVSNNYGFTLWTPARSVFSINHFVTKTLGFIGTVQYIQWNIFNEVHVHGIATRVGLIPAIVPSATLPFHLHNSWIFTIGSHYRVNPKWIVRVAGSYLQSSSDGDYQISNGDSIIIGGSTGYEFNQYFTLDGSYAHAFMKNQNIHITGRNIISGVNKGSRDAVSLKLTINI